LLWIVENFFDRDGVTVHELGFLYEAHLSPGDPLIGIRGDFRGPEDEPSIFFRWVPLPELGFLSVYPHFLRTLSAVLPDATRHIVIDERPRDADPESSDRTGDVPGSVQPVRTAPRRAT